MIPVQNIYYLLLYAWDRLPEGSVIDVSGVDKTDILDLFARVLDGAVRHVLRRGLDRSYVPVVEEVVGLRGRVSIAPTVARLLHRRGRTVCEFDELTPDNGINRIVRATLRGLIARPDLGAGLRDKLRFLDRSFGAVSLVPLSAASFRQVQLHGNNGFYGFLVQLCRLIYESVLVSADRDGNAVFREFVQEKLPALYESFVHAFYRRERPDLRVERDQIRWIATADDSEDLGYLPVMRTDISLRSERRCLIIDTKFYQEALAGRFDADKLIAGHLYQIFAYIKNMESRGGIDARAEAMLLYPAVRQRLRLDYRISGHRVRVCTVDLAADWRSIRQELLDLAGESVRE